jgi:hypothetical protein
MAGGVAGADPKTISSTRDGTAKHCRAFAEGRLTRRRRLPLLLAALVAAAATLAILLGEPISDALPVTSAHASSAPGRAQTLSSPMTTPTGTPLVGPSWSPGPGALAPRIPPTATRDPFLNGIISGQRGPGWIGGDASYSTRLPDGRVAFVFSDTLIGTARSNGTAAITGLTHSSELVGRLPNLVSDYAGSYRAPGRALIPDSSGRADTWQTAGTSTVGSNQLIFVNEFKPPPNGIFDTFLGRSGIAVMVVPAGGLPSFSSIVPLPTDPDTEWGNAVMQTGGYLYVYGSDIDWSTDTILGMKVARVATDLSLDTNEWTYWSGSAWVGDESNAADVPTTNQLTGVTPDPDGSGFIGVSVPGGLETDHTVDLSYAVSPEGPWTKPRPVYPIPEVHRYKDEIAYMPTFHPVLSSSAVLVVSYNINTTRGFGSIERDIHAYQPQFLLIRG